MKAYAFLEMFLGSDGQREITRVRGIVLLSCVGNITEMDPRCRGAAR